MFLCARNSLLIYSSPRTRISFGKNFLCVRSNLLYSGIGGNSAIGAGLRPLVDPTAVGVAISRRNTFILLIYVAIRMVIGDGGFRQTVR